MAKRPAVYADTNVLVPPLVRNVLMELALAGAIDLHWSPAVLAELKATLVKLQPGLPASHPDALIRTMNEALPGASVDPLPVDQLTAIPPDIDDRHVLAAALAVPCSVIATFNQRHFPSAELTREAVTIRAAHPDALLLSLITADPVPALTAVLAAHQAYKAPPLTDVEFRMRLMRNGLPRTADLLARIGHA